MIDFSEEFKFGVPPELPSKKELDKSVDHAPKRPNVLDEKQKKLAIANSLRYFPKEWHEELAIEFSKELNDLGHIYMHRFRPIMICMHVQYPNTLVMIEKQLVLCS